MRSQRQLSSLAYYADHERMLQYSFHESKRRDTHPATSKRPPIGVTGPKGLNLGTGMSKRAISCKDLLTSLDSRLIDRLSLRKGSCLE